MTRAASTDERITRDDLEAKFREVLEGTREEVASAKPTLATVAAIAAVVLVAIAYLLGRRQGRKRTTIVEIRRM
jgi:hypothetical protein